MVAGEESDSEYMWKEELIEFTDGLDKRYEWKRRVNDSFSKTKWVEK